ncbi:DUF2470 domain-containing protein [Aeromicrobium sp. UC242_57]|uniref:DUF2470 domain-containing protein n=1 Tax=Aeromicrobium sp. UC242_57 TaxID=3374624 RepID=UPI00378B776F
MTTTFSADVVEAVLGHMNGDHTDDNLVIVRAFAEPDASSAIMTGFDGEISTWEAAVGEESRTVTIPWPGPVVERADIRREVVNLYDQAAEKLGLAPRERH